MSEPKSVPLAYPRLCLAYFLQFAVWGSYGFALTGYALNVLKFSGPQMGWVGAAIPIGALFAPLVGRIADRFLSAQYVLSILQFICAGLLIYAGLQKDFMPMMVALILVGIFYMPTIPLINSIVFEHVPNKDNAPRVFMFGTIGWIVIVLVIQAFFGAGNTEQFFYVGAACSLILAVYALTLPNTPPKAVEATSTEKAPSAWSLMAQPKFLCFAIAILIAGVAACGLFFGTCFAMLGQRGYPGGLALTTLNQFSEVLFMALLPIFATRFGLKKVILIGIAAWLARYVCFMEAAFGFALLGLFLHGLCYSFLYAGSYMYGDKIAPKEMKASVQSFIGMILLGVGQIGGYLLAGYLVEWYPVQVSNYKDNGSTVTLNLDNNAIENAYRDWKVVQLTKDINLTDVEKASEEIKSLQNGAALSEEQNKELDSIKGNALPLWTDPAAAKSVWNMLDLAQYVKSKEDKAKDAEEAAKLLDLSDIAKNGKITYADLEGITSKDQKNKLSKEAVASLLTQVQFKLTGKEVEAKDLNITREQYLQAQTNDWKKIFMVPAIMMAAAFIFFLLFGKNPTDAKKEDAEPAEA